MSQKCYALLVGINKYHPQSVNINTLKACLNDVEAMQDLLEKQYAVPTTHIRTLLNEQATRKNIIQNFREHLTANADENTTVLFYYSGHGSRQSLPKAFQKYVAGTSREYRREETLVCYDSRAYIDNRWIEKDLADKELAILIKEAAQKNAHIVIILDCCHSGSGTRSKAAVEPNDAQKREVKERVVEDALHRNYLDHYYEKMLEATGEITLPSSPHILLAGTQKDRVSWETIIGDQRRGVFTYYLEQALWANPHLTYADLFSLVHPKVNQFTKDFKIVQNPQFETYNFFNAHSHFLTGAVEGKTDKLYGVKMVRSEWRIEQGEVHGLPSPATTPTIEWAIYESPNFEEPLAWATTTRVGMDYNVVEIVKGELNFKQNYLAELRSKRAETHAIGINVNPPPEDLQSPLFQLIHDPATPEQLVLNVARDQYAWVVEGHTLATDVYDTVNLITTLEKVARWHQILKSHQDQPQLLNYKDFPFTFQMLDQDFLPQTVTDSEDAVALQIEKGQYFAEPDSEWHIPYKIMGQNLSETVVYFTLLHLDPLYGIQVYYNDQLPAQTNEIILAEGRLFPEDNLDLTMDRFKLLVSTQKLKSYLFEQQDITQHRPTKNKRSQQKIPEDWLAKVLTVEITKQSS
ncbi:MAG TPA: hypothetical protein DCS93_11345 [Microscillaceae bacterium]|nr:hypothetical protein [Microscillaceae bacterium]